MEQGNNLFLVGPMGVGKTTVGLSLAKRLEWGFADSDREIERLTGVTIPLIFEIEGEAGFRQREHEVLAQLVQAEGIVLATGGGAVLLPENRELLRSRGFVVYLRAPVSHLCARTAKDKGRPLLQIEDPRARLLELQRIREPFYREVADLIVDTASLSVRQVVHSIVKRFPPCQSQSPSP
jgi:shikimate kinase